MYLIGLAAKHKGAIWLIPEGGLSFGREPDNDVIVAEPVVSRHHARIERRDGRLFFKDLGSVNPALVNGVPKHEVELHTGDEIALGHARFLCVNEPVFDVPAATVPEETKTVPLSAISPASLKLEVVSPERRDRPGTVRDLALLYEINCDLSGASNTDELLDRLRQHLRDRFEPDCLAVALLHGHEDLSFHQFDAAGTHPQCPCSRELMHEAIRSEEGLLVPRKVPCREKDESPLVTLIAPISVGKAAVGAIAIGRTAVHGAYSEEDLRLLMLLSRSFAPVLCAIENLDQLRRDNDRLRARSGETLCLIGESRAMGALRAQINRAAKSRLNVLLLGETGTGKELVARLLHARSAARAEPFIAMNCAAIPRDLFESELFGYEKNAFTGATEARAGLLAQAHGGTLFLDEIGDLSLENQARILRAVELGTFRSIGAEKETRVEVRIIAATNKDLVASMRSGTFREDLYHRIAGVEIHLPALRERPSDIPLLARHFLELARHVAKRPIEDFDEDALELLRAKPWPGNVRELRNAVFRAIAYARGKTLRINDLIATGGAPTSELADQAILTLEEVERRHIASVLEQCGGNVRKAAAALQVSRTTLYAKLAEYEIR